VLIRTAVPTFLSSDHEIQAAVRGEDVALGRSALVTDDLVAGRLVRPFELSLTAAASPITWSIHNVPHSGPA